MKLFLIIYVAGQIGGTAGPLPYDMKECERRSAEMMDNFSEACAKPDLRRDMETITPKICDDALFVVKCERYTARPAITYKQ